MALIMVVLRPAVEVTGSIWSGSDERAPARSCPIAEELESIELMDHTSERDIRLCCWKWFPGGGDMLLHETPSNIG